MSFTILSDSDIKQILGALSPTDVSDLVQTLEQALVQYSCKNEQQYQPHRAVVSRPGGQVTLFMPASTEQLVGVKIVGISPSNKPADVPKGSAPPPALKSAVTLCDATGQAIGVLNAAELTAFRTALGSMLMYRFRSATQKIVVFGAGKQALWHIRLAILLRGEDIRSITIVNRSSPRTQELVDTLSKDPTSEWPSHISLNVFEEQVDRGSALEALVVDADVVFCTTPSTQPLFPATVLTSDKARAKTRFISAIGSYRLDMQEIDPDLLKQVVDPAGIFSDSVYRSVVAVDSREGCLQEAGELVKAEIPTDKMFEIGQIFQEKATSDTSDLTKWLESGLVIYKSVGVGVMDLAIGRHLLDLAKARQIGITAAEF
ncbi:Fc.00g083010.m01.CDS01 [Cosmosporella sp. VM-42]